MVFRGHISLKRIKLCKIWQNMYPNAMKVFGETLKKTIKFFHFNTQSNPAQEQEFLTKSCPQSPN